MAKQPLTVGYRITFLYTIDGIQHRCHNYCELVSSGDSLGYNVVVRPGYSNAGLSGIISPFFNIFKSYLDPAVASFDGIEVHQRSGTNWVFLLAAATTVVPTGSSGYEKANGFCVSLKDTDNLRLPAYLFEGTFGSANKNTAYAGLGTGEKAIIDYFGAVGSAGFNVYAYAWRRSQNGKFVQRWLADVIDTNEKLRRLRGIK